jgi:hypothetical protein
MNDTAVITIVTSILATIQTLGTLWIRQIVKSNACSGEKCQSALKAYFQSQQQALQSKSTPAPKEV